MVPGGGNTRAPRLSPSKRWCFTAFNIEKNEFITKLVPKDRYIIGTETCPSTGRQHLQGYVEFHDKVRPLSRVNYKDIHWEKARGTVEENIAYCSKDDNYITNMPNVKKPLRLIKKEDLYPWQLEVIDIITKEPDDRTIYWFWDEVGKRGKTMFSKYLYVHYGAIPLEGKKNDILFCAARYPSDIYIWDLERSMENYVSYAALEKIKNGFYMNSKYESEPICRNSPHIIIFANFPPDERMLSKDRWVIRYLGETPIVNFDD